MIVLYYYINAVCPGLELPCWHPCFKFVRLQCYTCLPDGSALSSSWNASVRFAHPFKSNVAIMPQSCRPIRQNRSPITDRSTIETLPTTWKLRCPQRLLRNRCFTIPLPETFWLATILHLLPEPSHLRMFMTSSPDLCNSRALRNPRAAQVLQALELRYPCYATYMGTYPTPQNIDRSIKVASDSDLFSIAISNGQRAANHMSQERSPPC